jgi:LysM repeat protein
MANENTAQHNESTSPDVEKPLSDKLEDIIASRKRLLVQQRLLDSAKFKDVLDDIRIDVEKRYEDQGYSAADLMVEQQTELSMNPGGWAPAVFDEVEHDTNTLDMRDIWIALFTPPNKPSISPESAAKQAENLDPAIVKFLKQERMFENRFGPSEEGDLYTRVKAWRDFDGRDAFDTKGALKVGKYALMAGVLVGTGGAAAPGMLAAYGAKKLIPMSAALAEKTKSKLEGWLVDKNLYTQEQIDEGNKKIDSTFKKITGSKWGKAAAVIGTIAVAGGAAFLANEMGAFDKISSLVPDVNGAGEIDSVEPSGVADVASTPASVDLLAHPNGGVFKDALLAKISAFDPGMGERVATALANSPEQLSMDDLRKAIEAGEPLARFVSDSELISQASKAGLDPTELRAALDVPISDVAPANPSLDNQALKEGLADENLETLTTGPQPDINDANYLPPTAEALANVPSVTVTVSSGDSLSEIIWDTYQDNGISIGASELYAPSELTDHPKGLVGHIAEVNGLQNPDMIMPGDLHEITLLGSEVGISSPALTEQALSAASVVADPMVGIEQVSNTQQISEEAILSSNILNAEAPETTAVTKTLPLWKGGAMGAAVVGGLAAFSKFMGLKDKKEATQQIPTDVKQPETFVGTNEITKALPFHDGSIDIETLGIGVDGSQPGSESERENQKYKQEATKVSPGQKELSEEIAVASQADEYPAGSNNPTR